MIYHLNSVMRSIVVKPKGDKRAVLVIVQTNAIYHLTPSFVLYCPKRSCPDCLRDVLYLLSNLLHSHMTILKKNFLNFCLFSPKLKDGWSRPRYARFFGLLKTLNTTYTYLLCPRIHSINICQLVIDFKRGWPLKTILMQSQTAIHTWWKRWFTHMLLMASKPRLSLAERRGPARIVVGKRWKWSCC